MTFKIFLLTIFMFTNIFAICQIKTVSSTCGNCQKVVSSNSKVGDRCPHCKVIWGKENSSIINNNSNKKKSESSFNYGNDNESSVSNNKSAIVYASFFKNYNRLSLENWISSSLNENTMKYSKFTNYDSYEYYDFSFRFDQEYLVVKYMIKHNGTEAYSISGNRFTKITKEVKFFPLYYFDDVRRTDISWIIEKKTNLVLSNRTHPIEVLEYSNCNSTITSTLDLLVDFGRNNDFDSYLEAAFKKLSLVYNKPNLNVVPNCESY